MLRQRAARGVEARLRKRLRSASYSPESLIAETLADDPVVDLRLMTERQQLAFLLRTTAQDASSSSSADEEDGNSSSSESSGEDEARPQALRRLRRGDDKENQDELNVDEPWRKDGSLPSPPMTAMKSVVNEKRHEAKISADACALCCRNERIVMDATAPLFLCATCDRKYPTQQTIARRTCAA